MAKIRAKQSISEQPRQIGEPKPFLRADLGKPRQIGAHKATSELIGGVKQGQTELYHPNQSRKPPDLNRSVPKTRRMKKKEEKKRTFRRPAPSTAAGTTAGSRLEADDDVAGVPLSPQKLSELLSLEKEVALDEIKKELQTRPTAKLVEDLRKKVKILQAVGYNSIEAEDWEVATSGEEMSRLESLLLDKNRKMEHELTQLKVKLSEKTSLLEAAEGKIADLMAKVNEQQRLIQKLEDDILKGYGSKERKGNLFDDWDLSEGGATELSENADRKHVSSEQDQSSMLKVICNQRDRFRARLRETEEEIRQLKEKIGMLTVDLEKTRADNVKLYGKIRYVQDYNLEKVVSRGSKKHAEDLESGFSSDVESKYKKIYEDDINPFAAFSKKERDQRYKELGFRDRITLSSGRFLLGNKYARTIAFFYTIGLHILVFTCLYRMSALSHLRNGPEEFLVGERTIDLPHVL